MRTQEEILQMKLEARDLEIVALKDALFIRNQMIQRLDTTIADLNTELNDRENQLEERNISIQALEKVEELVKCLKEAANICKEKNAINGSDAGYWLGAENAYLQVVKSVEREFEPDEDYQEESQCNTCGLTDDHSIDCPNNNSPFSELIRNGYD